MNIERIVQNGGYDLIAGLFSVSGSFGIVDGSVIYEKTLKSTSGYQKIKGEVELEAKNRVSEFISENELYYITTGTNAFYSGKVINELDCGTHTLFIAEVTEALELTNEPSATYDYYHKNIKPKPEAQASGKWVCKICGYVYEGADLPADFICPWCQHPASDFEKQ